MKIKSLTGWMLGAAFFAAAHAAAPQAAMAEEAPFPRAAYEQALERAHGDPRAALSEAYGKQAAVEDIMAVENTVRSMDDDALTQGLLDDLAVFATHPDEKTKIQAIRSIALTGNSSGQAFWFDAFSKLKTFDMPGQSPAVRAAAMEMIGVMGQLTLPEYEQDAANYLLSRLKDEREPVIRAAAIRALDYGSRLFNAEKAMLFRQFNDTRETDAVRGAAVHAWGTLGGGDRQYTQEAMKASIDALRVDNPGIVVREAAKSAVSLVHVNHDNDNYIGSDAPWVAQITPLLMAVLKSGHDDETRMTALWMWASLTFHFDYANIISDLNTAAAVRLSDPKNQKEYDQEVAAVRDHLQPALPAPQPQ